MLPTVPRLRDDPRQRRARDYFFLGACLTIDFGRAAGSHHGRFSRPRRSVSGMMPLAGETPRDKWTGAPLFRHVRPIYVSDVDAGILKCVDKLRHRRATWCPAGPCDRHSLALIPFSLRGEKGLPVVSPRRLPSFTSV